MRIGFDGPSFALRLGCGGGAGLTDGAGRSLGG